MVITETMQALIDNPNMLNGNYGSNKKIAQTLKTTIEDVIESKLKVRSIKSAMEFAKDIQESKSQAPYIVGSDFDVDNKSNKISIKTDKPLSPKEIEELVQVDGINTRVVRVWNKSNKAGTEWDYSVDIRYAMTDFYNKEELSERIKEIFSVDVSPVKIDNFDKTAELDLVLYISDDHLGMLLADNTYTVSTYKDRLQTIINGLSRFDRLASLTLVSLGDQMNGWNQQTTRSGHIVPSKSNKEQFDEYVSARKEFYDKLFSLNLANEYKIVEINNSNHSGLHFSYMANELLKLYLSQKFPFVEFINSNEFITQIDLPSGHTIYAAHGKDDRHQKFGMPLTIDAKTEVYITDYILNKMINPKHQPVHFVKGDQHRFAVTEAKNFRYVSVPAIADPSDWENINFGDRKSGALIEIYSPDDFEPLVKRIRF